MLKEELLDDAAARWPAAVKGHGTAGAETINSMLPLRLLTPQAVRSTAPANVMGAILRGVADRSFVSRPQLVAATSLARSTIDGCIARLIDANVLEEYEGVRQSRYGRPGTALSVSPLAGTVCAAEIDTRFIRLAISDLNQDVLGVAEVKHQIEAGPQSAVDVVMDAYESLLKRIHQSIGRLLCVAVSVPGPVDVHRGVAVRPPIMPGWDEFPLSRELSNHFGCPIVVDNDVNLMAIAESRVLDSKSLPMLVIKVDTGIGSGLVLPNGELLRGAAGAAGDIGHVSVPEGDGTICTCGNVNCLEAVASLEAVARKLTAPGGAPVTQEDVLARVGAGDGAATRAVRDAAATIGKIVAALVHFYNPARIVLASHLIEVTDDLLAGIRSEVYKRALPLATRNLAITHGLLGDTAAITGGLVLAIEHTFAPDRINDLLTKQAR